MEFPKTYIINLDKDTTRLEKVVKQLTDYNITNYDRIPAVYGKDLSEREIKEATSDFCNKFCTKSSIGCGMSHIKTYKTILANEDPYALILEDDVIFEDNFKDLVKEKLAMVPNDFDLVYLGCNNCNSDGNVNSLADVYGLMFSTKYQKVNDSVYSPKIAFALHAYIVSNAGAKKLLEIFKDGIYGHIDWQIQNTRKELNVYAINPSLVYQDLGTNISNQASQYPTSIHRIFEGQYDEYRIPVSYHFTIPFYQVCGVELTAFNIILMFGGLLSGIFNNISSMMLIVYLLVYEFFVDTGSKNINKIVHSLFLLCIFYGFGVIIGNKFNR
jgi:glycosyl transferase family 25